MAHTPLHQNLVSLAGQIFPQALKILENGPYHFEDMFIRGDSHPNTPRQLVRVASFDRNFEKPVYAGFDNNGRIENYQGKGNSNIVVPIEPEHIFPSTFPHIKPYRSPFSLATIKLGRSSRESVRRSRIRRLELCIIHAFLVTGRAEAIINNSSVDLGTPEEFAALCGLVQAEHEKQGARNGVKASNAAPQVARQEDEEEDENKEQETGVGEAYVGTHDAQTGTIQQKEAPGGSMHTSSSKRGASSANDIDGSATATQRKRRAVASPYVPDDRYGLREDMKYIPPGYHGYVNFAMRPWPDPSLSAGSSNAPFASFSRVPGSAKGKETEARHDQDLSESNMANQVGARLRSQDREIESLKNENAMLKDENASLKNEATGWRDKYKELMARVDSFKRSVRLEDLDAE